MILFASEFFVTFAPRNPPDRSDGRQVLVAGQHQPDGLLPGELRPPELEAAHPAAPQQPPGASLGPPVCPSACFFFTLLHSVPVLGAAASGLSVSVSLRSSLWATGPDSSTTPSTWPGEAAFFSILPKVWLKVQSNKTAD